MDQESNLMESFVDEKLERISVLEKLIKTHNHNYYNKDAPTISDMEYDALRDELKDLDPTNPILKTVGAPVNGAAWEKAEHTIRMGSLNKVNSEEEFLSWAKETKAGSFLFQDKCDGISLELKYKKGLLTQAITRGDGTFGEDITRNVSKMINVQTCLKTGFSGTLKGEIVLTHEIFNKYYEGVLKNARNGAGGIAKRLDGTGSEHLTVIYYDILFDNPEDTKFATEFDKIVYLSSKLGLRTVSSYETDLNGCLAIYFAYQARRTHKDNHGAFVKELLGYVMKDIGAIVPAQRAVELLDTVGYPTSKPTNELEIEFVKKFKRMEGFGSLVNFDIDGTVIRVNDLELQEALGDAGDNVKGQIAWKFANETRVSICERITWQVGKTGRVTPLGWVKPVQIGGATVVKASLYNMDYIDEIGLAVGDEVLVAKANDIIPKIECVTKHVGEKTIAPINCPVCKTSLVKEVVHGDEEGVHLFCPNENCFARLTGNIEKWVKTLEIDEIGESIIEVLVQRKMVDDISDLYKLKIEDVAKLDGKGVKSATTIIGNLNAKKEIPLAVFLAGLNVAGTGVDRYQMLIEAGFDTLEKIKALTTSQIIPIKGMGLKIANTIVNGLQKKEELIQKLLKVGIKIASTGPKVTGGKLEGKSFCFTGAMSKPRKELEELVMLNGGEIKSVGGKLTFLVQADPSSQSSKSIKAQKLGTKIISEVDFMEMVE